MKVGAGAMVGELDSDTVAKAYAGWAPVYDLVFGAVFDAGRKASVAAANGSAAAFSTSVSAPASRWAPIRGANRVVGVDYSEPMLRKALARVAERRLGHIETLAVMDAQHLGFPDASFDAVVAQYVITTVPDPEAALDEFARVTRPAARSSWSITSAPRTACSATSSIGWRRSRASLAGGRVQMGTPHAMGRSPRRRAGDRAPPGAAAGAVFADQVSAGRGGRKGAGGGGLEADESVAVAFRSS